MKSFKGVLLKPVDQQADRDDLRIDPDGVKFDPDEWIPLWRNFNYRLPEDWLGRGKVSREADGTLVVEGELKDDVPPDPRSKEEPWKLAIGVIADKFERGPGAVTKDCRLMSVAFTTEHQDPTQPPIVIGTTIVRRAERMNLVRLGHYFNPGNDSCQTALVVKVVEQAAHGTDSVVNLKVWDGDGDEEKRLGVRENTAPTTNDAEASFHLSTNCPWGR